MLVGLVAAHDCYSSFFHQGMKEKTGFRGSESGVSFLHLEVGGRSGLLLWN